jgi:membrane associated rhomboid family serine protease
VTEPEQSPDLDAERTDEADSDEEHASTPFDNPFFLPVLLVGFSIWFIYDGWFNPEMEWIKFNRIGGAVCSLLAIWFTVKTLRERRASSSSDGD